MIENHLSPRAPSAGGRPIPPIPSHFRPAALHSSVPLPPTIPMTGTSTALASSSRITPPIASAAIPPNPITVCRFHRMNRTIGNVP